MNEQGYPILEEMRILRTEALKSIRDRAFDILPLYLHDYSDGVVSGCKLRAWENCLEVMPGIVKHQGYIYLLKEPMQVNYEATEEYALLKLKFEKEKNKEGMMYRRMSIMISPNPQIEADELEICRFKLKSGAVLRTKYVDFLDYMTEFDTVNLIFTPASAPDKSSLLPEITTAWAMEAKNYDLNEIDREFCLKALSKNVLTYDEIAFYIAWRLEIHFEDWDNLTLYNKLCQILKDIKAKGERRCRNSSRSRREVYVD
ncbi:MAG: hypothetical protein IKN12_00440 [Selenomonadaceae bacterium]|nr:hypothetical protein [Selenomonadaceae bacterium]